MSPEEMTIRQAQKHLLGYLRFHQRNNFKESEETIKSLKNTINRLHKMRKKLTYLTSR